MQELAASVIGCLHLQAAVWEERQSQLFTTEFVPLYVALM